MNASQSNDTLFFQLPYELINKIIKIRIEYELTKYIYIEPYRHHVVGISNRNNSFILCVDDYRYV